jgi:hypothetical protein
MGIDTKTYWLTDRQSQCDFDFEAPIRSVVTYASPNWENAANAHLLKLQRLENTEYSALLEILTGSHQSANLTWL